MQAMILGLRGCYMRNPDLKGLLQWQSLILAFPFSKMSYNI